MADDLRGWRKVDDLPSLHELTRVFAPRADICASALKAVAGTLDTYRNPSLCLLGNRSHRGLTFRQSSGSVLLVFPWPDNVTTQPIELYVMGETTPAHMSEVVIAFHAAFEQHVLPQVAHAGDGA